MRILWRFVLLWIVLAAAGWFLGMPYLAGYMSRQVRDQNETECHRQWSQQQAGPEAQADEYCRCLVEVLQFTRGDLFAMAKTHALPAHLEAAMQGQADHCMGELQPVSSPPAPPPGPGPQNQILPDGSEVTYF